jgi:predicted translation initiation factor SUI1
MSVWLILSSRLALLQKETMKPRKTIHSLADPSELLPGSPPRSSPQPIHGGSDMPLSSKGLLSGKLPHDGKGKAIRVVLDKKGRRGKTVTIVVGLRHNPETMEEIARLLKQHCGAGGTVREGTIEIQGDNRGRVIDTLRLMNYVIR